MNKHGGIKSIKVPWYIAGNYEQEKQKNKKQNILIKQASPELQMFKMSLGLKGSSSWGALCLWVHYRERREPL